MRVDPRAGFRPDATTTRILKELRSTPAETDAGPPGLPPRPPRPKISASLDRPTSAPVERRPGQWGPVGLHRAEQTPVGLGYRTPPPRRHWFYVLRSTSCVGIPRHAGRLSDGLRVSPSRQQTAHSKSAVGRWPSPVGPAVVSPSKTPTAHATSGTPGSAARCPSRRRSVATPGRRCRTPRCRPDRARWPSRVARRPARRRCVPRRSPVRRRLHAPGVSDPCVRP